MDLNAIKGAIYSRRSHRAYFDTPLSKERIEEILSFARDTKPLYPDIGVHIAVLERGSIYTTMKWAPPQFIAIYSERGAGYLTNAGFILGQIDLYLQSRGLGACYIGLGKPQDGAEHTCPPSMEFVMLLAFGLTKEKMRTGTNEFERRSPAEISDAPDIRLEPARLSPSAMNSQSWYFTHEGDCIHAFRREISRSEAVRRMNRIDLGLSLASLYVAYPESFAFSNLSTPPVLDNSEYIGTITL